jgi:hypothetical protein
MQIGEDIDGEAASDQSGFSVDLSEDGNLVAIGANANAENGSLSGHVRIYQNIGGAWIQIGEDIDGEAEGDKSGASLCISSDGSVLIIGAPYNDGNGIDSGHVRVFDLSNTLSINTFSIPEFTLFPNPTKNQFIIQFQDTLKLQKVNIYNNLGQLISTSKETTINTSHLTPGIYFIEVKTNKGISSQKLIIE